MKNFLKKYGLFIVQGVVMIIMTWYGFQADNTPDIFTVKEALQKENARLNAAIETSKLKETELRGEMARKEGVIAVLNTHLNDSISLYHQTKAKMSTSTQPENPTHFQNLQECQQKYADLTTQLNLCLATNEQGDLSLNLCLEKTTHQQDLLALQDLKSLECEKQLNLTEQKLTETEKTILKLEQIHKKKLQQKNTIIYMVSILATITTSYLLLKK